MGKRFTKPYSGRPLDLIVILVTAERIAHQPVTVPGPRTFIQPRHDILPRMEATVGIQVATARLLKLKL
jgi:hypothetical protein